MKTDWYLGFRRNNKNSRERKSWTNSASGRAFSCTFFVFLYYRHTKIIVRCVDGSHNCRIKSTTYVKDCTNSATVLHFLRDRNNCQRLTHTDLNYEFHGTDNMTIWSWEPKRRLQQIRDINNTWRTNYIKGNLRYMALESTQQIP
jgi:hypothetical protein